MKEIKFRAMNEAGNWVFFSIWGINPPLDKSKFKYPCEYTGFNDVVNEEIFEGDVLQSPVGTKAEVVWHKGGWYIFVKRFPVSKNQYFYLFHIHSEFEKLGNKFENPELIKE